MQYDFQSYGLGGVYANLSIYQNSIPDEDSVLDRLSSSRMATATPTQTYVAMLTNNYTGTLPSQYPGLSTTLAPIYRIISNAQLATGGVVTGTAQEDVLLALVRLPNTRSFTTASWSSAPAPP